MRPEHYLNYGYTPTCQAALERLAGLFTLAEDKQGIVRLFDPCAGEGQALAYLAESLTTNGASVETYAVEIEASRANAAGERLDHVIQGDFRRTAVSHRSVSLAILNPPYDNTGGEQSQEKTIIRRTLPYLVDGGVIALVVPERLLAWAENKLKFNWLALFPSEDTNSPNQYVLVGQTSEEHHHLPEIGTTNLINLHPTRITSKNMVFRVSWLEQEERADALENTPLPLLYQDATVKQQKVIHPLRPGHRAAYLAGYAATLQLPQGYLRVAVRENESRKSLGDNQTRIVRGPKMTSYLLSKEQGLLELPFEELPAYAEEIDKAISLQTYVDEDGRGWPATRTWEDVVLDRINARLPELNGKRGLLPTQAVRAVGMARALLDGEKGVFGVMEMGTGKSQPLDSKVLTSQGWRRMGDIQVGDQVFGANGHLTRVVGVFPQGELEIYRVTFSDGSTTECCGEHLWTVQSPLNKFRKKPPKTMSLQEIKAKGLAHINGNLQYFIPMTKPVQFPEREQPLDAYLLGALLGDGSFSSTPVFTNADEELVNQVARLLPEGIKLKNKSGYDYRITTGIRGGSPSSSPNLVTKALRKMELIGHTASGKFIPKKYLYGSVSQREALLQGLLDTDGYASPGSSTIEYSTISPQLAEGVTFIVQSLGGTVTWSTRRPTYTYNGEKRQGQLCYRLTLALPNAVQPFRLSRKRKNYCLRTKYFPSRAILEISFVGRGPAQCIKVEAEDGLYLTDDCIVTHNTPIALTVRELVRAKKTIGLTVVLCPPHLLKKWKREAKQLIPDATVVFPQGNGTERLAQVQRMIADLEADPEGGNAILILSRSMVKLGPHHKAQLERKYFPVKNLRLWACPHCGAPATTTNEDGWGVKEILRYADVYPAPSRKDNPDAEPPRRLRNKSCPVCESGYAGAESTPRRWPLADVIYRAVKRGQIKNLFLAGDEIHEYRNSSLQGMAFSRLYRAATYAVLLTGTIFGGKASDLYRLLRWTSPELRQAGYGERQFVSRFGYMEAIETRDETRAFGRTKVKRTSFKERPGISPTIYRYLLPRTAFGALEDVAEALPPYEEQRITVPAPNFPVDGVFNKSRGGQLYHEKGMGAFMVWMQAALGYYNIAAVEPPGENGNRSHLYSFTSYDEDGEAVKDTLVLDLPYADTRQPLPKEAKLIEIAQAERARNRKIVLLIEQTTTRPLPQRLVPLLKQHGIRAMYLDTSRVQARNREEWIEKQAHQMDVLITHPKAVETGLDLLSFQTVVVYEAIYKVISLAQAIARVWRLRQLRAVKVISLIYEGNLESYAWPVIARKISWAKSVYGNFVQSGLGDAGMDENLDLLSALKNAITTQTTTVDQVPERTLSGIERQWVIAPEPEIKQVIPVDLEHKVAITMDEWFRQNVPAGKQERRGSRRQRVPKAQLTLF